MLAPTDACGRPGVAHERATKSPPRRSPALQAISRRDGRPVAIIDGRLVHEGDQYDDIVILRIGEDEVELELDGRRQVLRF